MRVEGEAGRVDEGNMSRRAESEGKRGKRDRLRVLPTSQQHMQTVVVLCTAGKLNGRQGPLLAARASSRVEKGSTSEIGVESGKGRHCDRGTKVSLRRSNDGQSGARRGRRCGIMIFSVFRIPHRRAAQSESCRCSPRAEGCIILAARRREEEEEGEDERKKEGGKCSRTGRERKRTGQAGGGGW